MDVLVFIALIARCFTLSVQNDITRYLLTKKNPPLFSTDSLY